MSKITYSKERGFPNLYVLRNDPALKQELELIDSIVDQHEKAKAIIRYAQARERMYIDLKPDAPEESVWEEEELDEDVELRDALRASTQWEEELHREVEAARRQVEKMGISVSLIDELRINGTTLEESIKELRKERLALLQKAEDTDSEVQETEAINHPAHTKSVVF